MNNKEFEQVITEQFDSCRETLLKKAEEYADDMDRLHNFKVAAKLQGVTPLTALGGMMAKHTVSVYDLIRRHEEGLEIKKEMWDEKIGDSLNYLLLMQGLLAEERNGDKKVSVKKLAEAIMITIACDDCPVRDSCDDSSELSCDERLTAWLNGLDELYDEDLEEE